MPMSDDVIMQQKRGPFATMPTVAPDGQFLIPTDKSEIWIGTGTGRRKLGLGTEHKTRYTLYEDISGVYADGLPGMSDPFGREGWYFTNSLVGQKINWYFYDPTAYSRTVIQFQSAYAIVTLDTNRVPYFAIYTQGNEFGWFKSRRVFSVKTPSNVSPGKYVIHIGADPGVYPELPRIAFSEEVSLSLGAYAPTETILSATLQTESNAGAGNYKFIAHQLGYVAESLSLEFDLKLRAEATRIHQQITPSKMWTIVHRMGKRPSVTTVDTAGNVIEGKVVYNSDLQITVLFGVEINGTAYLN